MMVTEHASDACSPVAVMMMMVSPVLTKMMVTRVMPLQPLMMVTAHACCR